MEDKHFEKVFWFCCALCSGALLFDVAVCFIPVPTGGQKYADILIGSLNTGALTSAVQYLLGGSPKGKQDGQVPVTGDNTNITVNPAKDEAAT